MNFSEIHPLYLKEIKETLDQKDLNLIEAILIRKKEQTEKEIEDLKLKRSALKRTIYSMERYRKSPKDGTITLEYINTRRKTLWIKMCRFSKELSL